MSDHFENCSLHDLGVVNMIYTQEPCDPLWFKRQLRIVQFEAHNLIHTHWRNARGTFYSPSQGKMSPNGSCLTGIHNMHKSMDRGGINCAFAGEHRLGKGNVCGNWLWAIGAIVTQLAPQMDLIMSHIPAGHNHLATHWLMAAGSTPEHQVRQIYPSLEFGLDKMVDIRKYH